MRESIRTIKFTGSLSIVFAVIAYLSAQNIEGGFIQLNSPWVSNNLVLTISGGILASLLTVLLCEIKKYRDNKPAVENYLFYQIQNLYICVYTSHMIIKEFLTDRNKRISDNLFDFLAQNAQGILVAIQNTDYVAFSKKNELVSAHAGLRNSKASAILSTISDCQNKFKIACNQARINNLNTSGRDIAITASDELIRKALCAVDKRLNSILKELSDYLIIVDQNCKKRFNWDEQKTKIESNYISVFEFARFEDFIKDGEEEP